MDVFAASAEHAAAPDYRMGPPKIRQRRNACGAAPCRSGKFAGAGQARPGGKCRAPSLAARYSTAARTRAGFAAGGIAAPAIGRDDQLDHGRRAESAGRVGARRHTLGRPDNARSSCVALPNVAHWRLCSLSLPPDRNFGRPGARAPITVRFRSRRSTAVRCAT